eukprot:INCI7667.7.p2 GENE.INCI7667.7~~INCI7667.7.p2  ORF type:complete len:244 (-),score=35.88 INCI7667.7:2142-2873(-)
MKFFASAAAAAALGVPGSDASASISVSPTFPTNDTVNATVTWTGIDSPAADDWVGAFCPFVNDSAAYITYIEVGTGAPAGKPYAYGPYIPYSNESASTWADGHGSVSFQLPDIRCEYDFLYFRRANTSNGTATSVALAQTQEPLKFPFGQPLGIHTSLTGNPTEMRVTWNSGSTAEPLLYYRQRTSDNNGLWSQAAGGKTVTYHATDLCGSEAADVRPSNFIDPGYFHTAVMTGLKPGGVDYE